MRKHAPRKWLHAILDLLPCILIPVFMIYSHRHTLTEQTQVDIQYKYQTNDITNINNFQNEYLYHCDSLDFCGDEGLYCDVNIVKCGSITYDSNDVNEIAINGDFTDNAYINIYSNGDGTANFTFSLVSENDNYFQLLIYDSFIVNDFDFYTYDSVSFLSYYNFENGSYNGLSSSNYNELLSVDVQDTNSSITDAFMNNFNGTVDRYFNFDSALPFTSDIYGWLNTNLFGGNIPPLATSIWHIIVYEFILDIMFIFYAFFMFLIDFTECLLEKPFDKGR